MNENLNGDETKKECSNVIQKIESESSSDSLGSMESDHCSICTNRVHCVKYDATIVLSCQHSFHASCLETWIRRSLTCPLCVRNFTDDFYQPMLNSFTNDHFLKMAVLKTIAKKQKDAILQETEEEFEVRVVQDMMELYKRSTKVHTFRFFWTQLCSMLAHALLIYGWIQVLFSPTKTFATNLCLALGTSMFVFLVLLGLIQCVDFFFVYGSMYRWFQISTKSFPVTTLTIQRMDLLEKTMGTIFSLFFVQGILFVLFGSMQFKANELMWIIPAVVVHFGLELYKLTFKTKNNYAWEQSPQGEAILHVMMRNLNIDM